jgi:hypothetical protein
MCVSTREMTKITKMSTAQWTTVNAIDSSPVGIPRGLFTGAVRGVVTMSEWPPYVTPGF